MSRKGYTLDMIENGMNETNRVATYRLEAYMVQSTSFDLRIPAGTKVLRDDSSTVTLAADVAVAGVAAPECGGGYYYTVEGRRYYVCDLTHIGSATAI